jgi:hypothetical protein
LKEEGFSGYVSARYRAPQTKKSSRIRREAFFIRGAFSWGGILKKNDTTEREGGLFL